ncbi:MAG: hypothetical protein B7Z08_08750, partial [Sphingomonadales bacterium 32-68-7]
MAVAAAALSAPALARDGEAYLGADFGVVLNQDVDIAIRTVQSAVTADNDLGYELGAVLGYDWGMLRTEAEVSYRDADAESLSVVAPGIPYFRGGPLRQGTFAPVAGGIEAVSVMANALLDFGGNDGVGFAVGGGAGHTWVDADYSAAVGPGFLSDRAHNWAWQGIAQLRVPVTDEAEIGLKYRYFNTMQLEMTDNIGRAATFELESHTVMVSLLANFGGAEAPPPPPPPPPPP